MEAFYTLPAESYQLTNGSSPPLNQSASSLGGNNLWAVGHVQDSSSHDLFYFDGIKGGKCLWHKFQTPVKVAEEVQLELTFEGDLGLRMDQSLYLGTVESVADSRISWSSVSLDCRDFQLGRNCVCYRRTDSETFFLSRVQSLEDSREVPSLPSKPSCYCVTSLDDVIFLADSEVLILSHTSSHFVSVSTSVARSFPFLSTPKLPTLSTLLVTSGHICGICREDERIFLLPLDSSRKWQTHQLSVQVRDLSPVSGTALSLLMVDHTFGLHAGSLETGSLHLTELPHSILPSKDVLLTCVRSIRSLFNKMDDLSLLCASSVPLSNTELFLTAESPGDQEMELEPHPFISPSSPLSDSFMSPTDEPIIQSEVSIISSAPPATPSPPLRFDWSDSREIPRVIGSKRPFSPLEDSPRKLACPDRPMRASLERRMDKTYLHDNTPPCPLPEFSFVEYRPNLSYYRHILLAADSGINPAALLQQTEGILAEQTFDVSEARQEVTNLSAIYPGQVSFSSNSPPPPPSAPPTQEFSL